MLERTHRSMKKLNDMVENNRLRFSGQGVSRCVRSKSPKNSDKTPNGLDGQSQKKVDRIDRGAMAQAVMAAKKTNKYGFLKDVLDITLRGFVVSSYKTSHQLSSNESKNRPPRSEYVSINWATSIPSSTDVIGPRPMICRDDTNNTDYKSVNKFLKAICKSNCKSKKIDPTLNKIPTEETFLTNL